MDVVIAQNDQLPPTSSFPRIPSPGRQLQSFPCPLGSDSSKFLVYGIPLPPVVCLQYSTPAFSDSAISQIATSLRAHYTSSSVTFSVLFCTPACRFFLVLVLMFKVYSIDLHC